MAFSLKTCQDAFLLSDVFMAVLSVVKNVSIMIGCVVTLGRVAYHFK